MTSRKVKVLVLPGDNCGPEVVAEGVKVLKLISQMRTKYNHVVIELCEETIG
ncbi:18146_t:CDS:1, partial [Racocetra fulgida]